MPKVSDLAAGQHDNGHTLGEFQGLGEGIKTLGVGKAQVQEDHVDVLTEHRLLALPRAWRPW